MPEMKLDYPEFDIVPQNSIDKRAIAKAQEFKNLGSHKIMGRASMNEAATIMIRSGKIDAQAIKGIKAKGINEHNIPTDDMPLILVNLHDGTEEHKKGITDAQAIEIQAVTHRPVIYSNAPVEVDFDAHGKARISTIDGSPFKRKEKGLQEHTLPYHKLEAIEELAATLEIPANNQRLLQTMTSTSKPRLPKVPSASNMGAKPQTTSKRDRGMSL